MLREVDLLCPLVFCTSTSILLCIAALQTRVRSPAPTVLLSRKTFCSQVSDLGTEPPALLSFLFYLKYSKINAFSPS